ncbi:hypothetical protein AURDEDRAFT_175245 [Auricularia subglabra TFB-10046 SS5]|nr:hypothetical protein AURDEDRAFT_175245 [Auricularia subglabra TFB-10046 SS5]
MSPRALSLRRLFRQGLKTVVDRPPVGKPDHRSAHVPRANEAAGIPVPPAEEFISPQPDEDVAPPVEDAGRGCPAGDHEAAAPTLATEKPRLCRPCRPASLFYTVATKEDTVGSLPEVIEPDFDDDDDDGAKLIMSMPRLSPDRPDLSGPAQPPAVDASPAPALPPHKIDASQRSWVVTALYPAVRIGVGPVTWD